MQIDDGFVFGRFRARVRDALMIPDILSHVTFVLVTMIDSSVPRAGTPIADRIHAMEPGSESLECGVLLTSRQVSPLVEEVALFTGFDELWLFAARPRTPKPADIHLVSPVDWEGQRERIRDWMRESGCVLGLGDGTELNVAATRESDWSALSGRLPNLHA